MNPCGECDNGKFHMHCSRCGSPDGERQFHSGAYAGIYCDKCFRSTFNSYESDPDGADEYYTRED